MLDISRLGSDDLDSALGLSTQAGWNQVAADWARFLALDPAGCFGGYVDGELVATTCVVTYALTGTRSVPVSNQKPKASGDIDKSEALVGQSESLCDSDDIEGLRPSGSQKSEISGNSNVSWIGMVLVEETHRHQGYGTAMFERGLTHALSNGARNIGLDATSLGAPLYRDHGFRSALPVERWSGTLTQAASQERDHNVHSVTDLDALASLDRAVLGVDRSELLSRLCRENGTTALTAGDSSAPVGYAIVRPGRIHPQVGPILARDATTASSLLNGVASVLPDAAVVLDTVATERTTTLLREHGLQRQRKLSRMSYESTKPLLTETTIWATVDFAWG